MKNEDLIQIKSFNDFKNFARRLRAAAKVNLSLQQLKDYQLRPVDTVPTHGMLDDLGACSGTLLFHLGSHSRARSRARKVPYASTSTRRSARSRAGAAPTGGAGGTRGVREGSAEGPREATSGQTYDA